MVSLPQLRRRAAMMILAEWHVARYSQVLLDAGYAATGSHTAQEAALSLQSAAIAGHQLMPGPQRLVRAARWTLTGIFDTPGLLGVHAGACRAAPARCCKRWRAARRARCHCAQRQQGSPAEKERVCGELLEYRSEPLASCSSMLRAHAVPLAAPPPRTCVCASGQPRRAAVRSAGGQPPVGGSRQQLKVSLWGGGSKHDGQSQRSREPR